MSDHTPGPWRVWNRDDGDLITNQRGDEGVAWVIHSPRKPFEVMPELVAANARMIAAAPTMYDALRQLHDAVLRHGLVHQADEKWRAASDDLEASVRMAADAIAEADGR